MKLGFIGTGAITEAVITGLLDIQSFDGEILVSSRSQSRSERLAQKFSNVAVETDNQKILDGADWIFLAVLPDQLSAVVSMLKFRSDHHVVSMVAGRSIASLQQLVAPAIDIYRIIPMPPIEFGVGPIVITPPSPELGQLFEKLGTLIQVDDEDQFSVYSASSAIMASYFEWVASQARWMEEQGIPKKEANHYSSSLFQALSEMAGGLTAEQLQGLSRECLTAGGLNEQVLNESQAEDWFSQMNRRLDRIADRLNAAKEGASI